MLNEPGGAFTCRSSTLAVSTILAHFMEYYSLFWGHGVISMINEPWVRLCVGHQHRQFWPILARFLDYYSPFWGREAISIIVEPQGALTCRS